jgi:hypothetical protein
MTFEIFDGEFDFHPNYDFIKKYDGKAGNLTSTVSYKAISIGISMKRDGDD